MKALLDTHSYLFWRVEPERLPITVRKIFEDPDAELFWSAASSWEIAIKYGYGKLELPDPPQVYLDERLDMDCIKVLAISHAHACLIADLPPIHRDPFDRLLIAQAMHEGLPLISGNKAIRSYPIDVIW